MGGFRLPKYNGMFGPGLYFAGTPLKSAEFGKRNDSFSGSFLRCAASTMKEERGQMLLCDVYLGKTRTLRHPAPAFDPLQDLQGGWVQQNIGLGDYNSVYAPGGL